MKNASAILEGSLAEFYKVKYTSATRSGNSISGLYATKWKHMGSLKDFYMNVHSSLIYNILTGNNSNIHL